MKKIFLVALLAVALSAAGTPSASAQTQAEKQQILNQTRQLFSGLANTLVLMQQNIRQSQAQQAGFATTLGSLSARLSSITAAALSSPAGRQGALTTVNTSQNQLSIMSTQLEIIDDRNEAMSDFLTSFQSTFSEFAGDLIDFLD
ncbi:MAG: hypothetical protein COU11_00350 [Candidatus Harrisonbacteria bacterium CG10_big_fil_rev_8_21_14_0_10_49_15]|uniref:Uncharacterized protein n=1 Tax=Candidatus Harrisonbacteria bacterium CG10_big_fil_rev_8_21_14_0_10_49_15 TaxID=1974587 RepID=A0A2H0UM13_9BACT|nr:MAG: hypothetical protein COU11_00350 [Candidatus Harrisonbacteria bacterium CG10_big_fil_rev_8_21_14_0_10_49_15]